jgi:copper homeostasis protein
MLEVITLSPEDALAAEEGGATRLEVTCDIEQDGLTPPLALLQTIITRVHIPVRAMLRPRNSFAIEDARELEVICAQARALAVLPIDGLVLGWLREHVADIDAALDALRSIPQVDTILHSGGATQSPDARVAMLRDLYTRCAARNITLLAGGGMDAALITRLRRETPVRAFHVGRSVRQGQCANVQLVRKLVNSDSR